MAEKIKTIKCPYCGGTGKDPWGIPSPLSNCQVCKGRGEVSIREPAVKCKVCGGTGVALHGKRMTCLGCGGKGWISIPEGPTQKCPSCEGTGIGMAGEHCLKCGGSGVVPAEKKKKK